MNAPLPLQGLRILDLTSVFMGPLATQQLADMGADVIKVEPPKGDGTRRIGPQGEQGLGPLFLGLNRNKRSIVLDLKQPQSRDALLALARTADALVYNIRPAAMARLGLGYEAVSAVNPRIVYAGLVGFSQRGRHAPRPAFDDLIQAASGLADSFGRDGSPPRYVPMAIADRMVGLYAFGVICAAMLGAARTGRGQRVDVPMYETMVSQVLGDHLYGRSFVPPQGDLGYPRLTSESRRPYRTRDGYLCCTVYTDAHWRAFFALAGQAERFDQDPRLASIAERTRHIDALYDWVAQTLTQRTTAEWLQALEAADIPCYPVKTLESLLEEPHLADIGFLRTVEHPQAGTTIDMASPVEWSEAEPAPARPAPTLGQHTNEVLREAGWSDEQIGTLMAAQAKASAPSAPPQTSSGPGHRTVGVDHQPAA